METEDIAAVVAEAALSPKERLGFLERCEAKTADELRRDATAVRSYVESLRIAAVDDPLLDLDLAERIGGALARLLALADRWSYQQRRLLAGAAAYFVSAADADDDVTSASGMVDDARVVRTVCEALDRGDIAQRYGI